MSLLSLAGCYTALITPFANVSPGGLGGTIDLPRLTEQLHFQAKGGVAGVVPCGTTGETPTLSDDEHQTIIKHVVTIAKPLGLTVIAGTGSNNTAHAIELQKHAATLGADAGLSVNPYYNKPNQEGLYRHFMSVADAADIAVVLYNIPGRSGVTLTPETIAKLAKHPNIIAVKEATGSLDSASAILQLTAKRNDPSQRITILSGDDTLTLPFAAVGAQGVVSVISNILPNHVQSMCDAFLNNNWDAARSIHSSLFNLSRGLLTLDTNPIPIKTAMQLLNRDSGQFRLPMTPPSNAVRDAIQKLLTDSRLLDCD